MLYVSNSKLRTVSQQRFTKNFFHTSVTPNNVKINLEVPTASGKLEEKFKAWG